MPGMPHTHAAYFPASHDLAEPTALVQIRFAGPKGQFVNRVRNKVMPNVKNAGTFIAWKTVHILRAVRLASTHRSIINRVAVGVTGLNRKAVVHAAFERHSE